MSDRSEPLVAGRILVVDDDETFILVLKSALQRRCYEVLPALDVASAVALAERERPASAVVDLRIGDESGLALVESLVAALPELQIVMLTGYASIATAVEAIKLGARHYLTKPADADQILDAFQRTGGDTEVMPAENPLSPKRLEWEHLQKVLMEHDGNISATARVLGMHRRTLQRKLQKRPVKQ